MSKISKRHMVAHLNELNKQGKLTDKQKNINSNKKSIRELDEYGVILL